MKKRAIFLFFIVLAGCRETPVMLSVSTHLMFQGNAGEAIAFYDSLFDSFHVESLEKYGADHGEMNGRIKLARVRFGGQQFLIIDSPPVHEFTFTPAMSLFVEFADSSDVDAAFFGLSRDGDVFMPLGNYPFSPRFGWVKDRFGVSWQITSRLTEG